MNEVHSPLRQRSWMRLVEYVVAYELFRLRHADQTRAFWAALGRGMPHYELRRDASARRPHVQVANPWNCDAQAQDECGSRHRRQPGCRRRCRFKRDTRYAGRRSSPRRRYARASASGDRAHRALPFLRSLDGVGNHRAAPHPGRRHRPSLLGSGSRAASKAGVCPGRREEALATRGGEPRTRVGGTGRGRRQSWRACRRIWSARSSSRAASSASNSRRSNSVQAPSVAPSCSVRF